MGKLEELIETARALSAEDRRALVDALDEPSLPLPEATALEIPSQVNGYWFSPYDEIPKERPSWDPTGAVLPQGNSLELEGSCLDLVRIEEAWFPLSVAGVYTYAHSASLKRGEPYRFVPVSDWGAVYNVSMSEPIEPGKVEGAYGEEVSRRARADQKTVRLQLKRLADEE